jgi:hypothetical protein
LLTRFSKQQNVFECQRLCHPAARITGEELDGIAARVPGDDECVVHSAFNRCVKTYLRHRFVPQINTDATDQIRFISVLSVAKLHHAQHVATENFRDVAFRITTPQQFLREVR